MRSSYRLRNFPHGSSHNDRRWLFREKKDLGVIQLLISQLFRRLSLEFFYDSFHDAV
jgi:hypothetical protein